VAVGQLLQAVADCPVGGGWGLGQHKAEGTG
jgi:hypothetical protein